jgi:hypothetical protein
LVYEIRDFTLPAVVAPECGGSYVVLQPGDGGGG